MSPEVHSLNYGLRTGADSSEIVCRLTISCRMIYLTRTDELALSKRCRKFLGLICGYRETTRQILTIAAIMVLCIVEPSQELWLRECVLSESSFSPRIFINTLVYAQIIIIDLAAAATRSFE